MTKTVLAAGIAVCALGADVTIADGKPAEWVQLVPMGAFTGRDGRAFTTVDAIHATGIVAATKARAGSMDLVIDYDHQTDFGAKPGVGGTAVASGWMKELQARADGIWARVEWTAEAARKLVGREYRYLSPVFQHTQDGTVTRILRAGLTNSPNLELAAVAAEQSQEQEDVKLHELVAGALGLQATATEAEISTALTVAVNAAAELTTIRAAAKAKDGDDAEAVITAIQSQAQVDPARYVPIETFTAVNAELAKLRGSTSTDAAEAAVNKLIEEGKLLPATKAWALGYAWQDLTAFNTYAATLSPIVTAGETGKGAGAPDKTAQLSDAEKAVCATMGWDEATYLAGKKDDI